MDVRFVGIQTWPGKKTPAMRQVNSQFKAPYSQTLRDLDKELLTIGAKEVLIQAYFRSEEIRLDGWPRSTARPKEAGVIVTFHRKDGKTISMPCDKFNNWECNLRAIALYLEALRKVDRYGVTQNGEQYRGWEALPPPMQKSERDVHYYCRVIAELSGYSEPQIFNSDVLLREAYNEAKFRTHPDKGGDANNFHRVQEAWEQLKISMPETRST